VLKCCNGFLSCLGGGVYCEEIAKNGGASNPVSIGASGSLLFPMSGSLTSGPQPIGTWEQMNIAVGAADIGGKGQIEQLSKFGDKSPPHDLVVGSGLIEKKVDGVEGGTHRNSPGLEKKLRNDAEVG